MFDAFIEAFVDILCGVAIALVLEYFALLIAMFFYEVIREKIASFILSIITTSLIFIFTTLFFIYTLLETNGFRSSFEYILGTVVSSVMAIWILYSDAHEKEIRRIEISLIPDRVEKYISMHGYTSVQDFIKYSNENPEFKKARKVQYTNPLYTKQVAENKKREQNKQKLLQITEPEKIGYGQFASFKYKEIVLTYFMKELPDVLKNIYMFDYADIYVNMPNYSDFFLNNMLPDAHPIRTQPVYHEYFEDISSQKVADLPDLKSETDIYDELIQKYEMIDKIYFQQACIGIINQLIADNIIGRVGSSDLFRSKIIPESNGNIVEGETIEISFDD